MSLALDFGVTFEDLYQQSGIQKIDAAFLRHTLEADAELANQLIAARDNPSAVELKDEAALIIKAAPYVEDFVGKLFGISDELRALQEQHHQLAPLYTVKRLFVQRRAVKALKPEELAQFDAESATKQLILWDADPLDELAFANQITAWEKDEPTHAEKLSLAAKYAGWAVLSEAGKAKHAAGRLFKVPRKLVMDQLVPHMETDPSGGYNRHYLGHHHQRHREAFHLTDQGTDLKGALDEVNYCIWCHTQGKDSCSRGLTEKLPKDAPAGARPAFRKSEFGVTLAGCPLEERISEMHTVKAEGYALGALAIITIDNPLCAMTGHRICNDCMKSCIYQKQQPVDIPQAETRILKDVLELPWGFEVYGLLSRWTPLDIRRPFAKKSSGKKVLVVGLGPAGINLSHHLMNDGHQVCAIDGLKIEPLDEALSGVNTKGERVAFRPIKNFHDLEESLNDRAMAGFGGVAEYGITVRWNKNFLKVLRLLLERREQFAMVGGVRFGGTLTVDDAWRMGFDHIALCLGAGKPTVLEMPNGLARGVRTASDFLMALQLTGAAKESSIANMQLRLPVVVIGGGLTGIDTATESLAYYPVQVEKFLSRYEILVREKGEAAVRAAWNEEEKIIAEEFIVHAMAFRKEREKAKAEGRNPKLVDLMQGWGGVTLAYRKRLIDAPSYTLNHEEVEKALEEGIYFAESLAPKAIEVDQYGYACAIKMGVQEVDEAGKWRDSGREVTLQAKTILVAAGTQPNTVLAREDETGRFAIDGKYFQAYDTNGQKVKPEKLAKPAETHVLVHHDPDGRTISFFGDLHPSFAGNVVKAFGSAKRGYPVVSQMLNKVKAASAIETQAFARQFNQALRAEVHLVQRLTPTIVEVVAKAPMAAKNFLPGQFYRLQNFETLAQRVDGTILNMEGLALTGAWVDREKGLVSTIVLEMGGSSDLCMTLKPGEPVIMMGPTGTPTETPGGETVLLVGGGLGNAVLFSIGQALRAAGSKVLYFAGYKKLIDRYKVEEIEKAADLVVWCSDEAPGFTPSRPNDKSFVGNIVQAIFAYAGGALGAQPLAIEKVDRIVAIGSDKMMAAVAKARHDVLKPYLKPDHVAVGSINSPMQCMMKEICAQCLQPHKDPVTGEETIVFSCFNQDQLLDHVNFPMLEARLKQNGVQEKLTAQWIDRCMKNSRLRDVA